MIPQRTYSLKHRIRSGIDRIAASVGLLTLFEKRMRRGLTLLMYHRILPIEQCIGYPLESLVIPIDAFRAQMQWIGDNCYVLPVNKALEEIERGGPFNRPLVSVTFDDGYADNAESAAPILEEFGLHGTFFITSGFVEKREPLWYDQAADAWLRISSENRISLLNQLQKGCNEKNNNVALKPSIQTWMAGLKSVKPKTRRELVYKVQNHAKGEIDTALYRPMTREQVKKLHSSGHEIASHTVAHPILPQQNDEELRFELEESSKQLQDWIGEKISGLCYPNGDFDDRVERAAKQAGYHYACTMQTGLNHPGGPKMRLDRLSITIPRTMIAGQKHSSLGFRSELCRLRELWR